MQKPRGKNRENWADPIISKLECPMSAFIICVKEICKCVRGILSHAARD